MSGLRGWLKISFLLCILALPGCARKTLVVRVPEAWGAEAASANAAVGILRQLGDNPDGIEVVTETPPAAPGRPQEEAF